MASRRKLVANLPGLGKLKASKKHPDRHYFLAAFGHTKKRGVNYFVPLRLVPTDALQRVIQWMSPEYAAATDGSPSPYMGYRWNKSEEDYIRIALDLVYKELARRVNLIHK